MTGVYISVAIDAGAEAELLRHLIATTGGRCVACGQIEPCDRRLVLGLVLADAGRLPRRLPGTVGTRVFRLPGRAVT